MTKELGDLAPSAQLTAGRELDALVAERVMGWEVRREWPVDVGGPDVEIFAQFYPNEIRTRPADVGDYTRSATVYVEPETLGQNAYLRLVPRFSTDISAAWQVVEKMAAMGCALVLIREVDPASMTWRAGFECEGGNKIAWAESAPKAICLAALKACDELPTPQAEAK